MCRVARGEGLIKKMIDIIAIIKEKFRKISRLKYVFRKMILD